jgi:hypothetical protein
MLVAAMAVQSSFLTTGARALGEGTYRVRRQRELEPQDAMLVSH